jgi:hypothetical protein
MSILTATLLARFLATLHGSRIRRGHADSAAPTTRGPQQPQSLRSAHFHTCAEEPIADWESAWIDLGGEG